jgi:colanic acid/amylovoran biosynthesis glycosyltransferase
MLLSMPDHSPLPTWPVPISPKGYNYHLAELMRIAYLVSRYPATNHTFILREIAALRSQGFDIRVISIRRADRIPEEMTDVERSEQQRTFYILPIRAGSLLAHAVTALRRPAGYLRGLLAALRLAGWNLKKAFLHLAYFAEAVIAGHEIDRVGISHLHAHFTSTVALIAARVFPIGFSISIHGPEEFDDAVGFGLAEKVARSRFICAISSYARSQLMRASAPAHWEKLEICRLGVDPAVFAPGPFRENVERFELICVARLAPVKAQQILIGACARLIASGRKLRLHLVGDGPDRSRLEQYAISIGMQQHVAFEGSLNQDEVIVRYRQSDIFALASFAEGVPVVLMEAMAMELPCVATWVNGVPELIRDQVDGLLVPPAEEEKFTAALDRLMKDPGLRLRLGQSARLRVIERYNLEKNAAYLGEVFRRRLLAGAQG